MANNTLIQLLHGFTDDEAVKLKYAEHLTELFEYIDAQKIGEPFSSAINANDYSSAVSSLAAYFRKKPYFPISEISAKGDYDKTIADNSSCGKVRVINIDHEYPDGKFDFHFNPTFNTDAVNHEWLLQNNRHNYWIDMSRAYVDTSDEKYAVAFRYQLLTWIAQSYIPEDWNTYTSTWRTIECGLRLLGTWQVAYDGFRRSPSLDDISLLLMISSMHRQSLYLMTHFTRRNWLMMETNGVYTFSSLFPEFVDSEHNRKIAAELFCEEMRVQILPDGMQFELTPDYHLVVFNCACNICSLAAAFGRSNELPSYLFDLIRKMTDAVINLSTPALIQPRTNDTYTIKTHRFTERAAEILGASPEYSFINTVRKEGTPPKGDLASRLFPYAGFAIMRSDWTKDATYACFDIGPLGAAHIHQDKLNLIIFKGDQELIFDDGGGQYEHSAIRRYAISSRGHNTVTVDGLSQNRKEPRVLSEPADAEWISTKELDYASATYGDEFGDPPALLASHKREVRFFKPDFFCVADTLTSADGNTHDYELLFHLDTEKMLPLPEYKNAYISDFGAEYDVAIIPMDGDINSEISLASGETSPMGGWFVGRNDDTVHKATTLLRKISGKHECKFITLIIPIKRGESLPQIIRDGNSVRVVLSSKEYAVDLSDLKK